MINKHAFFIQSVLILFFTCSSYGMEPDEKPSAPLSQAMQDYKKYGYKESIIKKIGITYNDDGSIKTVPFHDHIIDRIIKFIKLDIARPFLDGLTAHKNFHLLWTLKPGEQCTAIAHHPYKRESAIGTSHGNIHYLLENNSNPSEITFPYDCFFTYCLFKDSIKHVTYNTQGTQLAVSNKNWLHIIQRSSNKVIHTLQEEADISALVFDHDGKNLIYSTHASPITRLNLKTNTKHPINTHLLSPDWIIRSANGKQFASKHEDKICIWNVDDANHREIPLDGQSGIVTFSNEEETEIVVGRTDGGLFVHNEKKSYTTIPITPQIQAVAYCAGIKKVLIPAKDGKIIFFDTKTGIVSRTNDIINNNKAAVLNVFSEDGTRLVQIIKDENSNTKLQTLRYMIIGKGKEIVSHSTINQVQSMAQTTKNQT